MFTCISPGSSENGDMEAGRTISRKGCSCHDGGSGSEGIIGRRNEAKAHASIAPNPTTPTIPGTNTAAAGEELCHRYHSASARDDNGAGNVGSGNRSRGAALVGGGGRRGRGSGGWGTKNSSGRGSLGGRQGNSSGHSGSVKGPEPPAKSQGCLPAATAMKLVSLPVFSVYLVIYLL